MLPGKLKLANLFIFLIHSLAGHNLKRAVRSQTSLSESNMAILAIFPGVGVPVAV